MIVGSVVVGLRVVVVVVDVVAVVAVGGVVSVVVADGVVMCIVCVVYYDVLAVCIASFADVVVSVVDVAASSVVVDDDGVGIEVVGCVVHVTCVVLRLCGGVFFESRAVKGRYVSCALRSGCDDACQRSRVRGTPRPMLGVCVCVSVCVWMWVNVCVHVGACACVCVDIYL